MIAAVLEAAQAATKPDRVLDVCIHEVLTGELDQSPGSVPAYSADFDIVANLLTAHGFSVKMAFTKLDKNGRCANCSAIHKKWHMGAWSIESNERIAVVEHDGTAALCAVALLLKALMVPKGSIKCYGCENVFVADKRAIEERKRHPELIILCPECSLTVRQHIGEA